MAGGGLTLGPAVSEAETLLRLYTRLPDAKLYCSDGLPLHWEWLPTGRYVVGKGGAVNRNEGLHSERRTRLNRLGRRTRGARKVGLCWSACWQWRRSAGLQNPTPVYVENAAPPVRLPIARRRRKMAASITATAGGGSGSGL